MSIKMNVLTTEELREIILSENNPDKEKALEIAGPMIVK